MARTTPIWSKVRRNLMSKGKYWNFTIHTMCSMNKLSNYAILMTYQIANRLVCYLRLCHNWVIFLLNTVLVFIECTVYIIKWEWLKLPLVTYVIWGKTLWKFERVFLESSFWRLRRSYSKGSHFLYTIASSQRPRKRYEHISHRARKKAKYHSTLLQIS